jgi:hypothetical protein
MPTDSVTLENLVLDATFRSDLAADDYTVRLWITDPSAVSPDEADFGGYTPATVAKADWAAASGGQIATTGLVDLGTPSSDASDSVRFWSLHDSTTDELMYHAPLLTPRFITAGASPVRIALTVPYGFNN